MINRDEFDQEILSIPICAGVDGDERKVRLISISIARELRLTA